MTAKELVLKHGSALVGYWVHCHPLDSFVGGKCEVLKVGTNLNNLGQYIEVRRLFSPRQRYALGPDHPVELLTNQLNPNPTDEQTPKP